MGVHTWFYKKIEGPSDEEAVAIIKNYIQGQIEEALHAKSIGDDDYFEFLNGWYGGENSPFHQNAYIDDLNKSLSDLSNNLMDEDLFRSYLMDILDIDEWIPGRGYYADPDKDLPHNPFRGGNYDEYLFSLEETLKFLEANRTIEKMNEPQREYWESTGKQQVHDFWKNHPDGIIAFG
jgi:hypothetical protein